MYMLGVAILLTLLKYLEIGPVAQWPWWWILVPYGITAAWWVWADSTGYTKRKAVEKMEAKKKARIEKHKEDLGMRTRRR